MAFKDYPDQEQGVRLLQRSLERQRLAHAYLFTGPDLDELEAIARALAKTLNCLKPVRGAGKMPVDCCDRCSNCIKIDGDSHPDLHWVRPESKLRVVTVTQMRELMQEINLKPSAGGHKVAVIVAADRLNIQAANAFLKTLEEPPEKSILVLLTCEPQRMLETILSRCLRLNFGGEGSRPIDPADMDWLQQFSQMAAGEQKSLMNRYRLLDILLQKLNGLKSATEKVLTDRSPLQRHDDAEPELRERWESELTAAIEAEYRRRRADLMVILQRWLRDVWVQCVTRESRDQRAGGQGTPSPAAASESESDELLEFPALAGTQEVARRISRKQAAENLELIESTQRLLYTNVQEALALEVGLLKLHL